VQQLARHRTRTGLTAGVLFLALVVALSFGHVLLNTLADLRSWYGQTIRADFLVRGSMPDSSFLLATALPETLGPKIAACAGGAVVESLTFLPGRVEDRPALVLARTFAPDRPLPLDLREGEPGLVLRGLLRGEVVLGTALAHQLGLHRGDRVTLATPRGPRRLRVAGTVNEYSLGGQALYLEWKNARRLLDVPGVHAFLVTAGSGTAGAVAPRLRRFCGARALVLQSNGELRQLIDHWFHRVVSLLWGLMALAFVVAALGVVNTLTMNVLEQTRELGILRALGMKRRQVCKVILAQAGGIAALSLIPGAVGGLGLAYLVNRFCAASLGREMVFHIDGLLVAGCCTLAVVVALAAALLPAWRAARLEPIKALRQAGGGS
jgi:putative ABC transport system permease protein